MPIINFHPLTGFDLVRATEIMRGQHSGSDTAVNENIIDLDLSTFNSDAFTIKVLAKLDATMDQTTVYHLEVYNTGTDYILAQTQVGSNTLNIDFSVTSAGQIQYTGDTYTGFTSLSLTWNIIKI